MEVIPGQKSAPEKLEIPVGARLFPPGDGLTARRGILKLVVMAARPLDRNEFLSDFTPLERPSDPRQFCQIPECVCHQESPDAGFYRIALPGLQ